MHLNGVHKHQSVAQKKCHSQWHGIGMGTVTEYETRKREVKQSDMIAGDGGVLDVIFLYYL